MFLKDGDLLLIPGSPLHGTRPTTLQAINNIGTNQGKSERRDEQIVYVVKLK